MKKPDCRTKPEILQHARWDRLIGTPGVSEVSIDGLRILDAFIAFIEGEDIPSIWDLKKRHFLKFDASNASVSRLRRLKKAMNIVLPGQPATLVLVEALREKEAKYETGKRKLTPRVFVLKKSVPESELPAEWRAAFDNMDAGYDRNGELAPAKGMHATHIMKMRQLLCAAREANLPDELSPETVRAYARALLARDLAPATLRASFGAVLKVSRYIGADTATIALLAELCRIYETKAKGAQKQKYAKLQQTGRSPVTIFDHASQLLDSVLPTMSPLDQHARRNRAAALAIFSILPIRLADTRLVFGKTLLWANGGYAIDTKLSKSQEAWCADLEPEFNRFIDALILRGCDPLWLDQMREDCINQQRPLFITTSGDPVGYNYVSDAWRHEFGTGEHIARTIIHTFLGIELGLAGVDMAKAACGQRGYGIEKEYQDDALNKAQRLKTQAELSEIAKSFGGDPFAFT